MTASALIFLTLVWSMTVVATGYCFAKLLTSKRRFDDHTD